MHKKLMGAVAAAVMFAVPAVAQDDTNPATEGSETQIQTETEADLGTGGSGDFDTNLDADIDAQSTESDASVQGSVEADEPALQGSESDYVYGGSGNEGTDVAAVTTIQTEEENKSDMRGLTVTLGGGIEGYTGALGDQLDAGPAWGVSAVLRPTKVLGLELGYSGAANEIGQDGFMQDDAEARGGADIVRNGAHALATLGLSSTAVQPYALAGIGVSRYTVRADSARFNDDWAGAVPVGAGVRTHIGNFTADLRGTYSMMFDQDLATAPGETNSFLGEDFLTAGRWGGTLQIGTTW